MSTAPSPSLRSEQSLAVTWSFYIIFSVWAILLFPVHESAHYLAYRTLRIRVPMTLNTASPIDKSQRKPIAELAGPLANLLIASGATVAYYNLQRWRRTWAALALASALSRLVIYVVVVGAAVVTGSGLSLGNDEPIAAHLWGMPSLTLVAVLTIPFGFIVFSVARTFRVSRIRTILHVLGLGVTYLGVGMLVGNVLDPWLFPNR